MSSPPSHPPLPSLHFGPYYVRDSTSKGRGPLNRHDIVLGTVRSRLPCTSLPLGANRRAAPERRHPVVFLLLALALGLTASACTPQATDNVLDPRAILESHDWWDNRDWDWYEANIPFFDSPDAELNATYYYRWELLTKHLVYGSPESGYTFTEFIDRPFWSGTYGAISCPLGHQFYEVRWLKDRRIIEDFARYWFETPGAEPRSYSNWYGDAMWATYEVLADRELLRTVYPHMETQVEGWTEERWDPDHGMYRWVGAWDGMETNINSRLTDDQFGGAEGYRPTLNSYLFADLLALSRTAALFGEADKADTYRTRAMDLKARVQEELWDPGREFFFHQFAHDERDGIEAGSITYETGPFAGDPHGRELLGYVPWQFGLPDPGYESAWRFLSDPEFFDAPFGPTGVEQGDPQFWVSPRCCVWSGNAWPYATAQTLAALANLLHDYEQDVMAKEDYVDLLLTYARSHRMEGRPYLAEAADPYTGSWAGHNTFYHSEHYLHSGFVDLVITGLVGLRPQAGDTLVVNPLVPDEWAFFALEGVDYHGHDLGIVWDRDGTRYGRGSGLAIYLNGQELSRTPDLGRVEIPIPPPASPPDEPRLHDFAVNNDGGHFPLATASSSHPTAPPFYAVDGNRWYHPSPPNRWVAGSNGNPSESVAAPPIGGGVEAAGEGPSPDPHLGSTWFQVEFVVERTIASVELYFIDDGPGTPIEVTGEEETSGFPLALLHPDIPVLPPAAFEILSWDGAAGGWVEIPDQARTPETPEGRRSNSVAFPGISTARIRVVLHPEPGATVGLTELEAWGPGNLPLPEATEAVENLAWNPGNDTYPLASASYTNPPDSASQAVDGRLTFTRYSRNRWTAYNSPNPEDWLEVDFGEPRTVGRIELFLYGDGRGVAAPLEYRFERWNENGWEAMEVLVRKPETPTAWATNTSTFEPVTTRRVRVVFRHAAPAFTGVTEMRIWPD